MIIQDYIRLHSGRCFRYHRPRSQDICIEDIAHNLSHICRFTGATKRFYSVAEHSIHASKMAPKGLELAALMHDSQESLVGDTNSILKRKLPDYERIEMIVDKMMAHKYGYPYPMDPRVKEIDMRMLATEMIQLLYPQDAHRLPYKPYDIKLPCWSPIKARREFIKRFNQLTT